MATRVCSAKKTWEFPYFLFVTWNVNISTKKKQKQYKQKFFRLLEYKKESDC